MIKIPSACVLMILITGLAIIHSPLCGQVAASAEEIRVKEVITRLFKGMELGDSAMVRSCFASAITLATARQNKEGSWVLTRENSLAGFLKAVGTPHADPWLEEIWNLEVSVDGALASAWCHYAFYVGNRFSHCGADAFHLYKEGENWKIIHLADTRRPEGCIIPEEVKRRHGRGEK